MRALEEAQAQYQKNRKGSRNHDRNAEPGCSPADPKCPDAQTFPAGQGLMVSLLRHRAIRFFDFVPKIVNHRHGLADGVSVKVLE